MNKRVGNRIIHQNGEYRQRKKSMGRKVVVSYVLDTMHLKHPRNRADTQIKGWNSEERMELQVWTGR